MSTTTEKYGFVKPELTDVADITAMNGNWDTLEKELAKKSDTQPIPATSTDGAAYTATLDGITELYDGLTIRIVPDKVSSTTSPTLNLNGLGDVRIAMLSTFNNAAVVPATISTWLSAMRPVELTFHQMRSSANGSVINQYWIVDWRRPSASGLYGQVPVQNGGWFINSDTTDEDKADALENLMEIGVAAVEPVTTAEYNAMTSRSASTLYLLTDDEEESGGASTANNGLLVVENSNWTFNYNESDGMYVGNIVTSDHEFAIGSIYKVVWDNTEYICEAKPFVIGSITYGCIGNLSVEDETKDNTNEPFFMTVILDNLIVKTTETDPTHSYAVYRVYSIPVASESVIGGVQPVTKTSSMTQQVGVDDNGKLWTAPSSGEGGATVSGLPEVTTADNGKILQVVDGAWVVVTMADSTVADYVDEYIATALEGDY